jgi:hemerythrin-like domain-containing protein
MRHDESPAVLETQLVHDVHRRATTLLAAAAGAPISLEALTELRDFTVTTLDHHHHSEDHDLWPLLANAAPELAGELAALSAEHDQLALDLEALGVIDVRRDRESFARHANTVRDRVHGHLAHEEPILLPALRARHRRRVVDVLATHRRLGPSGWLAPARGVLRGTGQPASDRPDPPTRAARPP